MSLKTISTARLILSYTAPPQITAICHIRCGSKQASIQLKSTNQCVFLPKLLRIILPKPDYIAFITHKTHCCCGFSAASLLSI